MRRMIMIAMLALAAGCGDRLLGPVTTLDGNWNGIQNGYSMGLSLTQTGTSVSGSVNLASNGAFLTGTVTGTFVAPNVNLVLTFDGFTDPVNYTGTLSTSVAKMFAKLSGSGFNGVELDVAKH